VDGEGGRGLKMDGGSGDLCFWRGGGWVWGWRVGGGRSGGVDCWGGRGMFVLSG